MANENQVTEVPVVGTDEKQTNRTFSQSEYDKALAIAVQKETDKFKDFDALKQNYELMKSERQKEEEAKLSEIERANKQVAELTEKLSLISVEKEQLSKTALKAEVLSDPKFVVLPNAYRKLIDGKDSESFKTSAESVLTEYLEDMKKNGLSAAINPAPLTPKAPLTKRGPESEAEKIMASLDKRMNDLPWMTKHPK